MGNYCIYSDAVVMDSFCNANCNNYSLNFIFNKIFIFLTNEGTKMEKSSKQSPTKFKVEKTKKAKVIKKEKKERKEREVRKKKEKDSYVIVTGFSSGAFIGKLIKKSANGGTITLKDAIRLTESNGYEEYYFFGKYCILQEIRILDTYLIIKTDRKQYTDIKATIPVH